MSFLTIEEVIEEFDLYIDEETTHREGIDILGKSYEASQVLRDIDHDYYCKQLDQYIANNFLVEGDESDTYYRVK